MNLQDSFLNQIRVQKIPVSIYLLGGHQMKGTISGFDSFVILLDSGGKQNMIYKHAIATLMPLKPIPIFKKDAQEVEEEGLAPQQEPELDE